MYSVESKLPRIRLTSATVRSPPLRSSLRPDKALPSHNSSLALTFLIASHNLSAAIATS
ncbi:unnamed protein product [Chondrus crispus]|uniref:Uncharacterized protein n=1 Tax=Chondrus crispus TaxID=2769 RepID=R7QEC6_CHOCR|nr:unnamed protein product [Chondrus crispus]CDF36424.1 unnamed protein product [Chondrus crispus]|eukprot:XP_005716243.1 unnamed protein product [Chondrus crispus]